MSFKQIAAFLALCLGLTGLTGLTVGSAWAQQAPDALIKQVSTDVLESVKADKDILAGDVQKVIVLVDAKVMPHVNFQPATRFPASRSTTRNAWRSTTATACAACTAST